MKALVYHGPGEKSWIDVPDQKLQNPTDVILRIDTTICGTNLQIGAGPVGLAVTATAGVCGAAGIIAVDPDANRVEQAEQFGATDSNAPSVRYGEVGLEPGTSRFSRVESPHAKGMSAGLG